MKKKILAISLVVSLVAIAALGATLAYFTDSKKAINTFTVGNVGIDLVEPAWTAEGGGEDQGETVYAGEALPKDPTVTSTGANPTIVRMMVVMPTDLPGNAAVTFETTYITNKLGDNWVDGHDGWYYYLLPIETDTTVNGLSASTSPLFDHIRISTALTNSSDTSLGHDVKVYAQAMQAQGVFSKWSNVKDGISLTNPPIGEGKPDSEITIVKGLFLDQFTNAQPTT